MRLFHPILALAVLAVVVPHAAGCGDSTGGVDGGPDSGQGPMEAGVPLDAPGYDAFMGTDSSSDDGSVSDGATSDGGQDANDAASEGTSADAADATSGPDGSDASILSDASDASNGMDASDATTIKSCLGVFCIKGYACCNSKSSKNYGTCQKKACLACCM